VSGRGGGTKTGRSAGLAAALVLAGFLTSVPGVAVAFGTIEGGGQHREHERITRAAVGCHGPAGDCFEPASLNQLAGHGQQFGAVGSPDRNEVSDPAAHCDGADFLAGSYPRTREQATASLRQCVDHLRLRLREAVGNAAGLLDAEGRIVAAETELDTDCRLAPTVDERAKCTALESFGRALHGVQDFYAHSNWTDVGDPDRPAGAGNPPGLRRSAPSPVLDLRGSGAPAVPADLTTGCFVLRDQIPGVGACAGRVTHAALNKDNGLVDPADGTTSAPATLRGRTGQNFARAVAGAVIETRHQWREFRAALETAYGARKASLMACALTRDDPPADCGSTGRARTVIALGLSGLLLAVLGVGIPLVRRRRRARASGGSDVLR
jgi:hypothetical protein